MPVKIKAAALVGSLLVALTGGIITLENWKGLDLEGRIGFIQGSQDLEPEQKNLLLAMLTRDSVDQNMIDLFSRKAEELSIEASKASRLSYRRVKLKQAADFFERTPKSLQRLRDQEKAIASAAKRANEHSELGKYGEKALQKMREEYAQEKEELKDSLVEAFMAVGEAERAKESNQVGTSMTTGETERTKESTENPVIEGKESVESRRMDVGLIGLITLAVGLIGSLIASAKVIMELKKTSVELNLAKLKLEETVDMKPSSE